MARTQHGDREQGARLDRFETRMAQLKVLYEKYFTGLERAEPVKEREEVQKEMRDLDATFFRSALQRHRFQMLRARYVSLDQYLARNLFLIERGTHPRFAFRANLAEARRTGEAAPRTGPARVTDADRQQQREEESYRKAFDAYVEARHTCGQTTEIDYASVRASLRRQVQDIKSRFRCESVTFRVSVEDGQATLWAVPRQPTPPAEP